MRTQSPPTWLVRWLAAASRRQHQRGRFCHASGLSHHPYRSPFRPNARRSMTLVGPDWSRLAWLGPRISMSPSPPPSRTNPPTALHMSHSINAIFYCTLDPPMLPKKSYVAHTRLIDASRSRIMFCIWAWESRPTDWVGKDSGDPSQPTPTLAPRCIPPCPPTLFPSLFFWGVLSSPISEIACVPLTAVIGLVSPA